MAAVLVNLVSLNCHSNVNVLILVKIEAAATSCETECLSKKISLCTVLQNPVVLWETCFEFLLYLKFMQYYCLFKPYISRCQYVNLLITNNQTGQSFLFRAYKAILHQSRVACETTKLPKPFGQQMLPQHLEIPVGLAGFLFVRWKQLLLGLRKTWIRAWRALNSCESNQLADGSGSHYQHSC